MQLVSPSAAAVALAVAPAPLKHLLELERFNVTACMAVSAQGREAVGELARQTAELLNARPLEPRFFDRQVAFNLLAQVGTSDSEGHGVLERRLVSELREPLGLPSLKISVTCVQVPRVLAIAALWPCTVARRSIWRRSNAVLEYADSVELVEAGDYPTPVGDAVAQDVVYVGRVRGGVDGEQLNLWLTTDNVRKGAALNARATGGVVDKKTLRKRYLATTCIKFLKYWK